MDIEVERLINARNGTLVSLSDDMILAIGKRYFELASGKESVKETPKSEEKPVDVVEAAYIIKEYCSNRRCLECPFSYLTTSIDLTYRCCLRDKIAPDQWQLPPKEV